MSRIRQIIEAIGNQPVGTLTHNPVIYSLDNAKKSVKSVPARVIFPMQLAENEGGVVRVSFGTSPTLVLDWMIADMMLHTPVSKSSTIHHTLVDLAEYAGQYASVFQSNMSLLEKVTIEKINYEWGEYEFPAKSGLVYYGCLITHQIKEILE